MRDLQASVWGGPFVRFVEEGVIKHPLVPDFLCLYPSSACQNYELACLHARVA